MTRIELEIKKNIEQNAESYFEKSKKAKKKIEGVKKILSQTEQKLTEINSKATILEEKENLKKKIKKDWYEKFRWFVTSSGFLVIGGRDATTNEIIIKKHTEKNDLVFHTDMAGSPFFVIKSETKKIDQASIEETADATVSFSRAWKMGIFSIDVFYVSPKQVSKEAKSGEYLTKGSFMIRGKTNYVKNKANLAIGIFKDKLMCAPTESVKNNCEKYFLIEQGSQKVSDVAKKIKKHFNFDVDDIIRVLPSGGIKLGELVTRK